MSFRYFGNRLRSLPNGMSSPTCLTYSGFNIELHIRQELPSSILRLSKWLGPLIHQAVFCLKYNPVMCERPEHQVARDESMMTGSTMAEGKAMVTGGQ